MGTSVWSQVTKVSKLMKIFLGLVILISMLLNRSKLRNSYIYVDKRQVVFDDYCKNRFVFSKFSFEFELIQIKKKSDFFRARLHFIRFTRKCLFNILMFLTKINLKFLNFHWIICWATIAKRMWVAAIRLLTVTDLCIYNIYRKRNYLQVDITSKNNCTALKVIYKDGPITN